MKENLYELLINDERLKDLYLKNVYFLRIMELMLRQDLTEEQIINLIADLCETVENLKDIAVKYQIRYGEIID